MKNIKKKNRNIRNIRNIKNSKNMDDKKKFNNKVYSKENFFAKKDKEIKKPFNSYNRKNKGKSKKNFLKKKYTPVEWNLIQKKKHKKFVKRKRLIFKKIYNTARVDSFNYLQQIITKLRFLPNSIKKLKNLTHKKNFFIKKKL